MLKGEIARQRENLDNSIRQTLSAHRNFGLMDIWYSKMTETSVLNFLHSPVFTCEQNKVYDSPSSLPFNTTITSKINQLLKNYQPLIPQIVECVNLYFRKENEPLKYIPAASEIQFFSSSTFLALFGYCWCVEQSAAYVEALVQLLTLQLKHTGSVVSVEFRNSFIKDIIRQFMHTTGVQSYLRLSLSTAYTSFLYDESISQMKPNSPEYLYALTKYVKMFTDKLIEYLPFMPSALRYFFRKAFEAAQEVFGKDSPQAKQMIEIFFFDLLLQPALVNPKLFALIPETSVLPRTAHNTMLTRIFKWATGAMSIPESAIESGFAGSQEFKSLEVNKLLNLLCEYDGGVDGVFSAKLQNVSDMRFHLLLLSVNDVLFLCHIINTTIDQTNIDPKTKEKIKGYTNVEQLLDLQSGELINFWFQAFKLPQQPFKPVDLKEPAKLYLPILPQEEIDIPTDNISPIIGHLIVYLETINVDIDQPEDIRGFLEYQHKKAAEKANVDLMTRTQAVMSKLEESGASDDDILKRVEMTINKRTQAHSKEFANSFKQQECCRLMDEAKRKIKVMNDQLTPIIHQSLLRLFLIKNKNIQQSLSSMESQLCKSDDAWLSFFNPIIDSFIAFSEQSGLDSTHKMAIARQLHSTTVSMIPYNNYILENSDLTRQDRIVADSYDAQLTDFLKEEYSPILMKLFKTSNCFDQPAEVLRRGTSFGAPLERLQQIQSAMEITQNIYSFEAGEGCPGDDFLPLFIFVLLHARLNNLASVLSYIRHFLFTAEGHTKLLDSMENYCATTFRTSAENIVLTALEHK